MWLESRGSFSSRALKINNVQCNHPTFSYKTHWRMRNVSPVIKHGALRREALKEYNLLCLISDHFSKVKTILTCKESDYSNEN